MKIFNDMSQKIGGAQRTECLNANFPAICGMEREQKICVGIVALNNELIATTKLNIYYL